MAKISLTQMVVDEIKVVAQREKLTQRQISERSGVPRGTVQEIMGFAVSRDWPMDKLADICRVLGIRMWRVVKE